jgi:hypothetical protein
MSMNLTRRLGVLALIGMALLGATASMQLLTDRQRVELAIEVLTPLESRLTAKGVSNLRNILTRLTTLKGQLTDPNNTGGIIQVPVDCQVVWTLTSVSAWFPETCDATEIQTQTLTYTGTIVVSPSDGGLPCPDLTKTETQTQTCTYVPLPPPLSGDSPLARNEHPRLGMTLADRPLIKARVSSGGEWHAAFQAYVNYLTHSDQWNTASSHQIWVSNLAAGAGLVYQTFEGGAPSGITFPAHADTQAEWGAKGAEWLLRVGVDPGVLGEYTRMLFLAYDWLHPALSPTQKATLIQAWKATMDAADDFQGSEAHYPAYTGFFYSNSNYSAFYSYWVMAGLAAKGDGIEEAWLQTGIDRYAWAFRNTEPNHRAQITRESQRAGIDGGALQGWYYAQVLMSRLAPMEMAYRTANGISVATHYGDLQNGGWARGWVPYIVRALRPWHWNPSGVSRQILPEPGVASDAASSNSAFRIPAAHARHEFPGFDQRTTDLAIWFLDNAGNESNEPHEWFFSRFLSPKGTGESPETLGLIGDKAYQAGKWQWRTGWSQLDALVQVVAFRFGALAGAGQVTIDYGGVALPMGPYRNHDLDSGTAGFARNLLSFVDPTRTTFETTNGFSDDFGSMRTHGEEANLLQLVADSPADFNAFPVFRSTEQDGIGYLTLDLKRHYNSDTLRTPSSIEPKVAAYRRSVVYVQPSVPGTDSLRLFVFDFATSADAKFEKRQTWVSTDAPVIDGVATPGPSRNGSTDRKTTYTGATTIRMDQTSPVSGATRLFVTPLAPAVNVVAVQYRYDVERRYLESSFGMPFVPEGDSWSADAVGDFRNYGAWWRTELIPVARQLTDVFCTALEAWPSMGGAKSETEQISGTNFVGGRIGDVTAVHRTIPGTSGSFTLTASGTVYVAGLTPNAVVTFTPSANQTINGSALPIMFTTSPQGTVKVSVTGAGPVMVR